MEMSLVPSVLGMSCRTPSENGVGEPKGQGVPKHIRHSVTDCPGESRT